MGNARGVRPDEACMDFSRGGSFWHRKRSSIPKLSYDTACYQPGAIRNLVAL